MLHSVRPRVTMPIALVVACGHFACVPTLRPMDPTRPIETERGYRQQGEPLDRKDMLNKLSNEPAASSHVTRARVVGTLGVILASVGGVLIGYPVGEYLAGKEPHWSLAYAGGASAAVALPLAFWGDDSVSRAVEAHNRTIAMKLRAPAWSPAIAPGNSVGGGASSRANLTGAAIGRSKHPRPVAGTPVPDNSVRR